jgi:acetyl esterase
MPVDLSVLTADPESLPVAVLRYPGDDRPTSAVDLVDPAGAATSAILLVHGGSWYRGDRSMYRRQQHALAAAGHVVGSAGYTLAPDSRLADKMTDLATGAALFRSQVLARRPGIRTWVLVGGSAGAHLAALATFDRRFTRPDGVVCVYGPGRLDGWIPDPGLGAAMHRLVGSTGADDPAVAAALDAASPRRAIHGVPPPFLLARAEDDHTFPADVVTGWAADLRAAGGRVDVTAYPGTGHGFMINGSPQGAVLLADIDTFVRRTDVAQSSRVG